MKEQKLRAIQYIPIAVLLLFAFSGTATRQPGTLDSFPPNTPTAKPEKGTTVDSDITLVSWDDHPILHMVYVEGGSFLMGSPLSESRRDSDEKQHGVTIRSFYISKYEVTQEQYKAVMGNKPSFFYGAKRPVERVSWYDAVRYCNALSKLEGRNPAYQINGDDVKWDRNTNGYRLPTEAEWEYAARGGNMSKGYKYSGSDDVGDVAWYFGNSGDTTHDVGQKAANELSIYDMSGNVWEWCWDWYGDYLSDNQTNPEEPSKAFDRVMRGGGWKYNERYVRVAKRGYAGSYYSYNGLGFRPVAFALSGTTTLQPGTLESPPPNTPTIKHEKGTTVDVDITQVTWDESVFLLHNMVYVEGGSFQIGSPLSEKGRDSDEKQHEVTIRSFYISKYEVTQEQYEAVMGNNPSRYGGANRPVERVSWYDAIKYCNALSKKEGLNPAYQISGDDVKWYQNTNGYRLPTEAEWEYAARGGNNSRGYKYSGSDAVGDVAWYYENSGGTHDIGVGGTHDVGQKAANELFIYDMSGNVWEWCWDWYGDYPSGHQTNPERPSNGSDCVKRGGGWHDDSKGVRVASRDGYNPGGNYNGLGFRPVAFAVR